MEKKKEIRSQKSEVRRGIPRAWNLFCLVATVLCLLFFSACGSGSDPSPNATTPQPVLIASQPNSAPVGDTISLQGVGFSVVFNENIVLVGNVSAQALSHHFITPTPNGATEEITFQIPSNAVIGMGTLVAIVDGAVSNSIPFTVESP